jgi:DnaJ-class molecular chaperone
MENNYYNVLEVPETASIDEIKKSYRRLSMLYHPDRNKNNPEATAKIQKINEAYENLGDQDKKTEYDMMRNNPFFKMGSMGPMGGGGHGRNPMEDIFANIFGGMPFVHMSTVHPGQGGLGGLGGQGGQGLRNIKIFHNGVQVEPQGFYQGIQKPTPIVKNIAIPIDKILTGTTLPVDIERWIIQPESKEKTVEHETVYVTVPKGIDEGEIIVLRDKGNVVSEECKGDIKIFVKIENDTEFKRFGLDLVLEKTISVKEALCGFSFELKYITGKIFTITNNSGNIINNGYRKVIPNMGFTREPHTGNLIICFNVKFPEKLSDETMTQLKAINF